MPLFSRKSKSAIAAPVTQPHRGRPFDLMPPSFSPYAGSRLYYMLRQAVPLIDAAVMKTVRLTGGFDVRCADPAAQSYLDRVLRDVPVGGNRQGIAAFTEGYLEQLLTCGTAVGEIVTDAEGLPAGDAELDPSRRYYQYYDLNDLPTFRFTPEDLENVSVERLVISMEEWYLNELKAYVLDPKQKTWTEFKPNTDLENPQQYLDETGSLYCQFRPTAADNYVSIPVPTLTLEGMLKN